MSLINTIVSIPESLHVRNALREEFHRCGLDHKQITTLRNHAPVGLINQLDAFEDDMREDLKESEELVRSNKSKMG